MTKVKRYAGQNVDFRPSRFAFHDRFNADLRPLFYSLQDQPEGMCCHPYDCGDLLIAEEAGVIITDGSGQPLNGPLDVTTGISWAGYANEKLRAKIAPLLADFLRKKKSSKAYFGRTGQYYECPLIRPRLALPESTE